MKKIICSIFMLSVLIFLSCGGYKSESAVYQVEKLHAQAISLEETRLGIKPELATEKDFAEVIAAYRLAVDKYLELFPEVNQKEELSEQEQIAAGLGGLCLMRIAELNIASGDTGAAKANYADIEVYFPRNYTHQRIAWLSLAKIFDQEQKFDKVEQIYLKLLDKYYPPADAQMNPFMEIIALPVQLLRFNKLSENQSKIEHYTKYALDYYQKLSKDFKGTNLGLSATRFLAETYKFTGEPSTAIEIFKTVVDSTGQMTTPALMLTAQTYYENLKDAKTAKEFYNKVLARENDTIYTPQALIEKGMIDLQEKEFAKSRAAFQELIDHHDYARKDHPRALSMIAQSYEDEKNYEQAQNAYIALIEQFPTHALTYQIYVYLPEFFRKQGKNQLQEQWYIRAESFFLDNVRKYNNENIGAASQEYLTQLYMRYEKWDLAVKALKKLAEDYSDYIFAIEAYARIGAIFEEKLNMPDSAQYYYKKQIETYPDLAVSKAVEEQKIKN